MVHPIVVIASNGNASARCIVHLPKVKGVVAARAVGVGVALVAVVEAELASQGDIFFVEPQRTVVVAGQVGHVEVGGRDIAPVLLKDEVDEVEVEEGVGRSA